jgi:hypothetical protein
MTKRTLSALLPMLLAALPLVAQEKAQDKEPEKEKPQPQASKMRGTPVKLQVVFTRYQGEKKVGSVPYTLSVNADDRPGRIRMGIQVPIKVGEGGAVQYKDVGNNLDCNVNALTPTADRFKVSCSFEQTSVYATEGERPGAGSSMGNVALGSVPLFRSFRSETNLLLQDGQTALYTAATDPVSGEVLKIEVTLNVVR